MGTEEKSTTELSACSSRRYEGTRGPVELLGAGQMAMEMRAGQKARLGGKVRGMRRDNEEAIHVWKCRFRQPRRSSKSLLLVFEYLKMKGQDGFLIKKGEKEGETTSCKERQLLLKERRVSAARGEWKRQVQRLIEKEARGENHCRVTFGASVGGLQEKRTDLKGEVRSGCPIRRKKETEKVNEKGGSCPIISLRFGSGIRQRGSIESLVITDFKTE